jgi:ketosteroid isomerase-like protein
MSNLELVQQGYKDFAAGNIEAVLANWDPKIEWRECNGFPFIEGDGISIGPQAVLQDVLSQIPVQYDGFNIEVRELFEAGDKVVMVGFYTGTWKATGKAFKANATHVWTVKDGKATHFFQAVDTASIIG